MTGNGEHVDGLVEGRHDAADVVDGDDPRRVQHIGACLLVPLQPSDRVGEVVDAVQVVLGARGEHEVLAAVRGLGRGRDSLGGEIDVVDRLAGVAGEVLDRASGEA